MTKTMKKQGRLSAQAMNLIDLARTRYSTQPQKAIEYLQSIPAQQLNLYDRQKVGREILSRYDSVEGIGWCSQELENEEGVFIRKIQKDYQVIAYPRVNDREKPIPAEYGLKGTTQSILFGKISQRNQKIEAGKGHLREAKECGNDVEERTDRYLWAGNVFEKAGSLDRAIPAFKTALKYMNGKAKEYSTDEERAEMVERILKLEKLKAARDMRKASILEKIASVSNGGSSK